MKKFFCGERVFVLLELSMILFIAGAVYYAVTQFTGKLRNRNWLPMAVGFGALALIVGFLSIPALNDVACRRNDNDAG